MGRGADLRRSLPIAALLVAVLACSRADPAPSSAPSASTTPSAALPAVSEARPRVLYLPEGGVDVAPSGTAPPASPAVPSRGSPLVARCPAEMVDVAGEYCVDRWESALVRADDGRELSPYYPPRASTAKRIAVEWRGLALRTGDERARAMPLPAPFTWQIAEDFEPRAVARGGVVPAGYVSGVLAERACVNAGKRLCTAAEWVRACRGQTPRKFPYGDTWSQGGCNVFREAHPAAVLHDDPSTGHMDPRLNQVRIGGKPLLRTTGATASCRSEWGGDGIYDMVGNLDEWVADPRGAFHGGFYSRSTREGCDSRITAHPNDYFDYSLGVRCCR